jgi:translocation and assembly module TamA
LLAAMTLLSCAAATAARADEPKAQIAGVQDRSLRQAIERYLGQSRRAPQSRFEARRRAEDAARDAVVVLRSEGYYDYVVTPDVSEGEQPKPVVRIEPGPRSVIANPQISWAGPPPSPSAQAEAASAMDLEPFAPARAADVVAAEGRIVAALQKAGYADADALPREVVVDHAEHTLQPSFRIEAKSLAHLDGVQVKTTGRTSPRWVARLAPWKPGDAYSPEAVAELERRLLDSGVYEQVTVALAPESNADGLRPVLVSLADRPQGTISLGGSYSTREGPGVNGRYSIYNRLGRADTLSFSAGYANIMKRLDVQLSLPHWGRPRRTLRLDATAYRDDTTAYREDDVGVRADLEQRFQKTSFRTFGVAADYSRADEKRLVNGQIVGVQRDLEILTGLGRLSLDRSDRPLDPTRGWKLDARIDPTFATGDGTLAYAKAEVNASAYLPLGKSDRTVIAGRVRLGSIFSGGGAPDIPASRRFYAGGGGSIRGYAYQAVGPRFPDNTPIGGQSVVETSVELRQRVGGHFGVVGFVDAGTVSSRKYPDFKDFSTGAGVGLRYDLGFGPLRADIGFPLNRRKGDGVFQIYLSIGQSF